MTFRVNIYINGRDYTPETWFISEGLMPRQGDTIKIGGMWGRVESIEWDYTKEHTNISVLCRGVTLSGI